MSKQFDLVYASIVDDLASLDCYWQLYRQLYLSGEERCQLLNRFGSPFSIIQDSLFDSVVLCLGRMLDPAKSAGNRTASFETLIEMLPPSIQNISKLELEAIRKTFGACRDHRNKRAAHRDYDVVAGIRVLNKPIREDLECVIDGVNQIVNLISEAAGRTPLGHVSVSLQGDGDTLAANLEDLLRYRKLRRDDRINLSDIPADQRPR